MWNPDSRGLEGESTASGFDNAGIVGANFEGIVFVAYLAEAEGDKDAITNSGICVGVALVVEG